MKILSNIFILITIISTCLLCISGVLWFLFSIPCGTCQTTGYSISPGSYCPWPNECVNSYCVFVDAIWYPMNSKEHHSTNVMPTKYPDCWTTQSYSTIIEYLHKDYPIGSNHTCFIDKSWSDPNHISYDDTCVLVPLIFFYLTIVSGSIALSGIIVLIIYSFAKYRNTNVQFQTIVNEQTL